MIVTSIDIGTNTIRLLIAKETGECQFKFLFRKSRIARLGEGLSESGYLSDKSIERALMILSDYVEISKQFESKKVLACATSAVREAKNKEEFIKRVRSLGIDLRVIDADREAYLTHKGIVYFLKNKLNNKRWVAFDLGGGSTEFMFSFGERLERTFSVPLGVVKLLEMFIRHDPPLKSELDKATSFFIDKLSKFEPDKNIDIVVANAGTVTSLAAIDLGLEKYSYEKTEGYVLRLENIGKVIDKMLKLNSHQRLEEFRILEKGREDVIVVGAYLVEKLVEYFNKDYLLTTNGSLREGVLIEELCDGW